MSLHQSLPLDLLNKTKKFIEIDIDIDIEINCKAGHYLHMNPAWKNNYFQALKALEKQQQSGNYRPRRGSWGAEGPLV
jgi:hypothetical protein